MLANTNLVNRVILQQARVQLVYQCETMCVGPN